MMLTFHASREIRSNLWEPEYPEGTPRETGRTCKANIESLRPGDCRVIPAEHEHVSLYLT